MAKSILVIDDTAFMRTTLRRMLEENGFFVAGEAENGEQAVEKYKELKPDLVTMDITMPVKNGIDATKEIMEYDPEARIVVVSAMGQKSVVIDALNAGAKDFIVKPFRPDRVIEALQKVAN